MKKLLIFIFLSVFLTSCYTQPIIQERIHYNQSPVIYFSMVYELPLFYISINHRILNHHSPMYYTWRYRHYYFYNFYKRYYNNYYYNGYGAYNNIYWKKDKKYPPKYRTNKNTKLRNTNGRSINNRGSIYNSNSATKRLIQKENKYRTNKKTNIIPNIHNKRKAESYRKHIDHRNTIKQKSSRTQLDKKIKSNRTSNRKKSTQKNR